MNQFINEPVTMETLECYFSNNFFPGKLDVFVNDVNESSGVLLDLDSNTCLNLYENRTECRTMDKVSVN